MIARIRRSPAAAAVVGAPLAAHLAGMAGLWRCPGMTTARCLLGAVLLVLAASLLAVAARAGRLAADTTREVARLRRLRPPEELVRAAREAGVRRLRLLDDTSVTAFCAGLLRPRVHVTTGAVATLPPDGLSAVLAHEGEHARRLDPLRRLLLRASADVLFYLPLARWWSDSRTDHAEVRADRAAIRHAGRPAVAAALLAADAGSAPGPAFNGATQARVAHLLGDEPPARRPSLRRFVASLLGLIGMVGLAMCLAQSLLVQV
ncbi:M48 family metalloprotease [Spirillospora sp. NPDC052269]